MVTSWQYPNSSSNQSIIHEVKVAALDPDMVSSICGTQLILCMVAGGWRVSQSTVGERRLHPGQGLIKGLAPKLCLCLNVDTI